MTLAAALIASKTGKHQI